MMDDHRICLQAHGLVQQRTAGGDAGDNFCTVSRPST